MKYFDEHDAAYTAAGIIAVLAFLALYHVFTGWGWFGWVLNLFVILGTGGIMGQFFQTWHIDFKFRQELDNFEENIREALNLKKEGGTTLQ